MKPRYPIYIPSKGRADNCLTAKTLRADGVPFFLVIEPQEYEEYLKHFPKANILQLPFSNLGKGSIPARNWIKEHSIKAGALRHWQLDDNIRKFYRRFQTKRIPCRAGIALSVAEDFTDRYENIAISGLNYAHFVPDRQKNPPFFLNVHVYSCTLVLNKIPYKWRGRYNEDTDLCLQALAGGWCTILINAFLADKMATMMMKGGNTDELYQGDGRLKMARELERRWPGIVTVDRRFGRPQHVIKNSWKDFTTPLKLKRKSKTRKYAMKLSRVKEIRSKEVKKLFTEYDRSPKVISKNRQ